MRTRIPSSGPRPPTRSLPPSRGSVHALPTQATSRSVTAAERDAAAIQDNPPRGARSPLRATLHRALTSRLPRSLVAENAKARQHYKWLPAFQLPLQGSNLDSSDPEATRSDHHLLLNAGFRRGFGRQLPESSGAVSASCGEKPHRNRTVE